MAPFRRHVGRLAVLGGDHTDTDRIIPARFLSRIERAGYGELLFADARDACFPLDAPEARGADVLLVGTNFGCGSSREHAVWAIQQAGFRAVIARRDPDSPGYSDIFRQNAANCGLLLVEIEPEPWARLEEQGSGARVVIDLEAQTVAWSGGETRFEIAPATRSALLQGLDLIGTTLAHSDRIAAYEAAHVA
jgi:3-isopropylmalate/(R)-2-methylmalate dehydratase small subunit